MPTSFPSILVSTRKNDSHYPPPLSKPLLHPFGLPQLHFQHLARILRETHLRTGRTPWRTSSHSLRNRLGHWSTYILTHARAYHCRRTCPSYAEDSHRYASCALDGGSERAAGVGFDCGY